MQAYAEIVPPSAVTHAVSISLLGPKTSNLVVAKTSLLQIFNVKTTAHPTSSDHDSKLVFVGEYPLAGVVTSLAKVKILNSKSGGEALLVTFRDAKMSLVEWDPEAFTLNTISIHYYEGDESATDFFAADLDQQPSYSTVDPGGRCAALKFGPRNIAILPLRHATDDFMLEEETQAQTNGSNPKQQKKLNAYTASFKLPLTLLDSNLTHPIHLAFLHEYRDPTLGILSSSRDFAPHLGRKDNLTYSVFTLDIEGRARTPLLSVKGLPSDLFKVVPMPLPVGGSLLIGANEVVHVDQSGKTRATGVNEFSLLASSFSMSDQSSLGLRLEHSQVAHLNTSSGEVLLVLNDGRFVIVSFRMDGRLVAGLSITAVSSDKGGDLFNVSPSCAAFLSPDLVFLGSDEADSSLFRFHGHQVAQQTRKRSQVDVFADDQEEEAVEDEDEDENMGEDDDLYTDETAKTSAATSSLASVEDLKLSLQDTLSSLVSRGDAAFANPQVVDRGRSLEMAVPTTSGHNGSLAIVSRSIRPLSSIKLDLGSLNGQIKHAWHFVVGGSKAANDNAVPGGSEVLIVSYSQDDTEKSAIFLSESSSFIERTGTDFEAGAATRHAGLLAGGTRILQATASEVRCYDLNLGLSQIIPMVDEETDAELKIVHTSFWDPFLLVVRDDKSILVLRSDKKGDIEEVELGDKLIDTQVISGSIHCGEGSGPNIKPLLYLLTSSGGLHIYDVAKPNAPLYVAENLAFCPYVLAPDRSERRAAARATLKDLLVTDLGDANDKIPHLLTRTDDDDIIIYRPYHFPPTGFNQLFTKHLRWLKQPHGDFAASPDDPEDYEKARSVTRIPYFSGFHGAIIQRSKTSLVLKEASGRPRIMPLDSSLQSIVGYSQNSDTYLTLDVHGSISKTAFKVERGFSQTGVDKRVHSFGSSLDHVTFHPEADLYILGLNEAANFKLPEDDWHQDWANEDISLRATNARGMVKLFDRKSETTIDEFQLEVEDEQILCLKTMSLEISEKTHQRKTMLVAGTAVMRGEDQGVDGAIYVFDIITVVPEPDRPETNRKLKLLIREEVRGAVTAMSETGNSGFIMAAQGQKCMVRGLKEDNTLLPIAFMDMQCYASVIKGLPGTGLALTGDALKGIRFCGFSPDPYKLQIFGKSKTRMEVVTGELLPDGKQLMFLVADRNNDLLVYEYNPEHPGSLKGQRLLKKSSFHMGQRVKSMALLPVVSQQQNDAQVVNGDTEMHEEDIPDISYQVMVMLQTGAIVLVAPIDEQQYRRLGTMQTHLQNLLDHTCGLNPRSFRAVESEGFGGRGILDGDLIRRWYDLSRQRQNETCSRIGTDRWQVQADLDLIAGSSLAYL